MAEPIPMCNADNASRDAAEVALDALRVRKLERNGKGQLVAYLEGRDEPLTDVRVRRYFPWSQPEHYFAICDADGKELAMLHTLHELDPGSRELAEAELADKVFNPKITRVLSHKREFGLTIVTAETDRGKVTFEFNSREDVRILSPTRGLFRDVDGTTLEVADISKLDPITQRYLQRYF